jgi:hypothetical protein
VLGAVVVEDRVWHRLVLEVVEEDQIWNRLVLGVAVEEDWVWNQ